MRSNRFIYFHFLLLFLSLLTLKVHAQEPKVILDSLARRLESLSNGAQKTSIYIRSSKDIYESMEDLWFKAYSVNVQHQLLSSSDRTLYVQLIKDSSDSIVWEELYPIEKGIASGHIYLDNSFPNGIYWLCAYSAHSFDGKNTNFTDARKIEIVRSAKELIGRRKEETFLDSTVAGIQFNIFPEGGMLLSEVNNKVGFKAVTHDGQPQSVSGTLLEGGKAVSNFNSLHDGMGYFIFRPKSGKAYSVKLDKPYADSVYQLPEISLQGLSFSLVENREDSLVFSIYNTGPEPRSFYVRVQTKGLPAVMAASLVKDSILIKFPVIDVSAGIAEATLFDTQLRPLAERLVYIKPNDRILIKTRLSRKKVGRREKVSLHIQATDHENKPVIAQLGAVAYDRLYHNPSDPKDIQTHYLLSSHLRGSIHNPSYYFDTTKIDRLEALDLLLLTQGWRSYRWNESQLAKEQKENTSLLSDGINGRLSSKRESTQLALILFDADQTDSRLITIDDNGKFSILPENMDIGNNIYIKHFGKVEDFDISVYDPFKIIRELKPWKSLKYPQMELSIKDKRDNDNFVSSLTRGAIKLEEVVVTGKKEIVFRDKYIGHLDSLAKYQNNTDRTHGGWLNCPTGDGDQLPIEGKSYIIWTGQNPPASHPFTFDASNTKRIVYHYPKYTEKELLKMFGIVRTKGYYPKKTFYEPVYDKEKDTAPDFRNTLLWAPNLITDENGDAHLEFFSSDLNTEFYGIIEGIDGLGALGKSEFHFTVDK